MRKRVNWTKLGISRIQDVYGYDESYARYVFKSVYKRLWRKFGGSKSELNISKETYASLFNRGKNIATINVDTPQGLKQRPQIIYNYNVDTDSFKQLTLDRFAAMADKYPEIQQLTNQWNGGLITYKKLLDDIQKFKNTNARYHASGSGH